MKTLLPIVAAMLMLVLVPAFSYAQTTQQGAATPSISQPIVREGTVAVKLAEALQLGSTTDEAQAESLLSSAGVAPRNGWIADYPVTPDIASELRDSVENAAATGSLKMDKNAALVAYDGAMDQYNLAFREDPAPAGATDTTASSYPDPATAPSYADSTAAPSYPDPTVINNYYQESPPVVTYYAPPAAYVGLYNWVPYPFWWWNSWFPGFFVLADFHRPFFFGGHLFFVSNHFFDRDDFVRVNAFERFERFHRFGDFDRFRDRFHDRNFDRFRDRSLASRRVIGPSTVRTGAEAALRHDLRRNTDHRSASMHNVQRTMNSPVRNITPGDRSSANRMTNNRSFDRGSTLTRQPDRTQGTLTRPSRPFGTAFGGDRGSVSSRVERRTSPSIGSRTNGTIGGARSTTNFRSGASFGDTRGGARSFTNFRSGRSFGDTRGGGRAFSNSRSASSFGGFRDGARSTHFRGGSSFGGSRGGERAFGNSRGGTSFGGFHGGERSSGGRRR